MSQKLSAMKYVKNNKRRVAVLIVSMTLFSVMIYLSNYLITTNMETFRYVLLENPKKMQVIELTADSYGLDTENTDEASLLHQYQEKNRELAEAFAKEEGVEHAYACEIITSKICPPMGMYYFEGPLVEVDQVQEIVEHFDAELVEGRMPKNAGEVVVDRNSMNNANMKLNGYFMESQYKQSFRIVGILECDTYLVCGVPSEDQVNQPAVVLLSDGRTNDIRELIARQGIDIDDHSDVIYDATWGEKEFQTEVVEATEVAARGLYLGIVVLLSISIYIVYITYLRDRREEWCLYQSIGYSKSAIYGAITRELLITFVCSIGLAAIICVGAILGLEKGMIEPLGIHSRCFQLKTIVEILVVYFIQLGMLQLPICLALHKIKTIDAIENDLI